MPNPLQGRSAILVPAENTESEGSEVGKRLGALRNQKEADVARAQGMRRRVAGRSARTMGSPATWVR